MPIAVLKPCTMPGCITLVQTGRCDQHRQAEIQYHPERQQFYGRSIWKQMRTRQLAAEPWCAECLKHDVYQPATDVDHVTPHQGDLGSFLTGELQSLCHVCHSRKTLTEVNGRGAQNV